MMRIVACLILAPVLLFVVQAVTATLLLPPMPVPEGGIGFMALSTLITAWVMTALASTLTGRGWRRAGVLVFVATVMPLNNLVEAVFFPVDIPRAHLLPLFLYTLGSGALFALLLDRLAGTCVRRPAGDGTPRTLAQWAVRMAVSDAAYIALYFTAGMAVWPFVREFYGGRALPATHLVLLMQVFRGLVWSAVVYVLLRHLAATRLRGALLVAATLALAGGVAPLLVPNPYMPASIRFPHMVEVGVSNLLFALIAAVLLRPAESRPAAQNTWPSANEKRERSSPGRAPST